MSEEQTSEEQTNEEQTSEEQTNDPLHGVTLKNMVTYLVDCYGWDKLGDWTRIRCFLINPTLNSSLKFLRRTPWARTKVENLYVVTKWNQQHKAKRGGRSGG